MARPLHLKVFLSSPGDVADERQAIVRLIKDELPYDELIRGHATFDVLAWDDRAQRVALLASLSGQASVDQALGTPSECDLTVVVVRTRLGTPPDDRPRKADGTPYRSGTEWELWNALEAKKPVLVCRGPGERTLDLNNLAELEKQVEQVRLVKEFFDDLAARKIFVNRYRETSELVALVEGELKRIVRRRLEAMPSVIFPGQATGSRSTADTQSKQERLIDEAVLAMRVRDWPGNQADTEWVLDQLQRGLSDPVLLDQEEAHNALTRARAAASTEAGQIINDFTHVRAALEPVLDLFPPEETYLAEIKQIPKRIREDKLKDGYYKAPGDYTSWCYLLLMHDLGMRMAVLRILKERLMAESITSKAYKATLWLAKEVLRDEFPFWKAKVEAEIEKRDARSRFLQQYPYEPH